ncbi:MAG: phosphoglycolate phosphatase [Thiotrichales bacterium]|nr:MAG: phosphoglycolate phosphatase [Thiotrichales bacterium]PCI13969.1 MAG: phosphoglycolate phosphatase [Thiotrichales bacterium]
MLFDLDGTLADTAQDLVFTLNTLLQNEGHQPLPFEQLRPMVTHGANALIELGFGEHVPVAKFKQLTAEFLEIYQNHLSDKTVLFPGMAELLVTIEGQGQLWGVVTNKPSWLTNPLMEELGLAQRAACIVSGDTVEHKKPHPQPMFHACDVMGVSASECIYVGDARRDIEAGQRAGMKTIAALFGYINDDDDPATWGADGSVEHASEIIAWQKRFNQGSQ